MEVLQQVHALILSKLEVLRDNCKCYMVTFLWLLGNLFLLQISNYENCCAMTFGGDQ
jgi:hypothetical protein